MSALIELGERAFAELRAENYGLNIQREKAISGRLPWRQDWIVIYDTDGWTPIRMEWGWVKR